MYKKIILSPNKNKCVPPRGLKIKGNFERKGILNPAVVQDEKNHSLVHLLSRLIYRDEDGDNSCIIWDKARLNGEDVEILDFEKTILQADNSFGSKGVEDLRATYIDGESPLHGFLVYFDGVARTGYIRTKEPDIENFGEWDRFGVFFPNISSREAIKLVGNQGNGRYKKRWYSEYNNKDDKDSFLGTKDCCLLPRKIEKNGEEVYGIIIRLLPDMQIVYVRDFKELAKREFWQSIIKDLESHVLLRRENGWEKSHIGLAGPPFEIKEGIIIPYHGAVMVPERNYKFGLALVDKKNPQKVLARTKEPFLETTEDWEEGEGLVSGKVVFPTGNVVYKGSIHWFYGVGDKYVAHCVTPREELLNSLYKV